MAEPPNWESEDELASRVSRGDGGALEALMERLLPDLDRFLRKRAGPLILGKESGSDLAQSVCREMLERLADERLEFRGEGEFKQWLYRAAELKLQNRRRFYLRDRRNPGHETSSGKESLAERLAHSLPGPSQAAVRVEELERLQSAFERLDERSQQVIRLFHMEGLTHREIALRMAIEEGHSRTLLARALARLARLAR